MGIHAMDLEAQTLVLVDDQDEIVQPAFDCEIHLANLKSACEAYTDFVNDHAEKDHTGQLICRHEINRIFPLAAEAMKGLQDLQKMVENSEWKNKTLRPVNKSTLFSYDWKNVSQRFDFLEADCKRRTAYSTAFSNYREILDFFNYIKRTIPKDQRNKHFDLTKEISIQIAELLDEVKRLGAEMGDILQKAAKPVNNDELKTDSNESAKRKKSTCAIL